MSINYKKLVKARPRGARCPTNACSPKRLATADIDVLMDARQGLKIITDIEEEESADPMKMSDFERYLEAGDLKPVGTDSLKWAIASPRFEAVVFDEKGMPLRLVTVDPRAFVLHKWHVSQQPDREPLKRHRDEAQARLVATLLRDELRELSATQAVERAFPHLLRQQASSRLDEYDL
jgi:hypothetical protein